jgi:hypothetical protein
MSLGSWGGACGLHGEEQKYIQGSGEETWRKELLGRPRLGWVGNIKMDLKEIGWEDVEWINLAEDTDKGQSVCEHSIELWLP